MFGFSISKVFFTIVIIFAVFWVYRQINMISEGKDKPKVKSGGTKSESAADASAAAVEDLKACPACGAYVAAGSNPGCGRPAADCPMQS